MEGYLGEVIVNVKNTPFKYYKIADWILHWIEMYGWIDGTHHKDWLLDQQVRIIHSTPIIIKMAEWDDGNIEYRFSLDDPTPDYHKWVSDQKYGEDGPNTYSYYEGIAP